ncbi:hypothetical protein DFS34DRAFT_327682 [Phlyctochytrium arcticum]|nr:hypothetical protein DFS34DRAFT_327682 [Phlyctochytrium arcticum]
MSTQDPTPYQIPPPCQTPPTPPIPIILSSNQAFVWDPQDVMTLRETYHIVGELVGTSCSNPQQNDVYGLPLLLCAEEVAVLLEIDAIMLIDADASYQSPTAEQVKQVVKERESAIKAYQDKKTVFAKLQSEHMRQKFGSSESRKQKKNRKRDIHSSIGPEGNIVQEEQQPLDNRLTLSVTASPTFPDPDIPSPITIPITPLSELSTMLSNLALKSPSSPSLPKLSIPLIPLGLSSSHHPTPTTEISALFAKMCLKSPDVENKSVGSKPPLVLNTDSPKAFQIQPPPLPITLPMSSSTLPWYAPSVIPSSSTLHPSTRPTTSHQKLRIAVFRSLWQKGYYLSSGSKFGGDWIAYPGDPLLYHSHYIITTADPDKGFTGLDIVRMGRLANVVKKTFVVGTWEDECEGRVRFISVEWTGWN